MKLLLIGGGGREHALAWKMVKSPEVQELICIPGNAGIALEPRVSCLSIQVSDLDGIIGLAREKNVDLVVVGPEAPLVNGIADRLAEVGIPVLGPNQKAAGLEGSKVFAKQVMQRYGIPTADFQVFDQIDNAIEFVRKNPKNWVIKADGLAAGKGVFPCRNVEEAEQALSQMLVKGVFGKAGSKVVVEDYLEGEEVSCIALTDSEEILLLASSQDHKRAFDGDRGPNTGGMGAYSPAPVLDAPMEHLVLEKVFRPLVQGLAGEGILFRGIIYAGLMINEEGPKVLEFNVRFGDPETQPQMVRLRSDLVPALMAAAHGSLSGFSLKWEDRPAVCVVMASGGYPGEYEKGVPINGMDQAAGLSDVVVFHAGTSLVGEKVVTSGGRVLGVTALGQDIQAAVKSVYQAVEKIHFDGAHYRTDIAHRALERIK